MSEAIRLVIWDLDETFWQGTITEGGHRYNQETHNIVLELARRGIMSSICSKNDLAPVRAILTESGLWDSFIFPSINWDPKGPRIAALIEAVQLRAPTVLFIDDNASNLNEARHFAPGVQTADETIVPNLLDDPRLRGKDDRALSRLAQYKMLERRRQDEQAASSVDGGGNVAFLRASNIRVRIERDVEKHIDRAIELINRTNQLNFTKRRLPEDPQAARATLRKMLDNYMIQAGLLEVSDNYGDHGYCGFYLNRAYPSPARLVHFCFSCRILGMGVEAWAYQSIGRPELSVSGHVLSDPQNAEVVDWISEVSDLQSAPRAFKPLSERSSFAARGGCVLAPLAHYFAASARETVGEYNTVRDGNQIRLDHSLCFRHAMEGTTPEMLEAASLLGYERADFESRYFDHSGPAPLWVFSNWSDLDCPIYRHRISGVRFPSSQQNRDVVTPTMREVLDNRDAHFVDDGHMSGAEMQENLRQVFARVPAHGRLFVLLGLDTFLNKGGLRKVNKRTRQNAQTIEVASEFAHVHALDLAGFIEDQSEVNEGTQGGHFSRAVYFRVYRHIAAMHEAVPLVVRVA